MKTLKVILFSDSSEFKEYSNRVCEAFLELSKAKKFCGCWDISFNKNEVLDAISDTINHFINNSDKTEIIFGCCEKDYNDIISQIHTKNCIITTISCKEL